MAGVRATAYFAACPRLSSQRHLREAGLITPVAITATPSVLVDPTHVWRSGPRREDLINRPIIKLGDAHPVLSRWRDTKKTG
jgi:hypothetical protein